LPNPADFHVPQGRVPTALRGFQHMEQFYRGPYGPGHSG
jgi:hypothetical protein